MVTHRNLARGTTRRRPGLGRRRYVELRSRPVHTGTTPRRRSAGSIDAVKLSPPWRKALLTLHVITAVGWLGIDLVLLTLGVAGSNGADPDVVYPATALVGQTVFVPLSVLAWLVGVASALLTPWGLVRHRWVLVKLVITTVMLGAVLFALLPNLQAAELGAATPQDARQGLLAAPIVSSTLLVVATVLSTYKPWGRRSGRRAA
ncbi:hypothetical protein C6361_33910 [Plantactinospora sp. BC1]|uniref:hypothetical protein n=1 Tax=Plantactinospora sp. BC1 TaxID=2108470 RepID=UPI000D17A667|nr:hypothetical protein [Plantactinospora sp. BC1]AVT33615.1 hypothetical protein C6361_33910 [Plantactinospora sp. BC1]